MKSLTRRDFLKVGGLALVGTAGGALFAQQKTLAATDEMTHGSTAIQMEDHNGGLVPGTAGEVDHKKRFQSHRHSDRLRFRQSLHAAEWTDAA